MHFLGYLYSWSGSEVGNERKMNYLAGFQLFVLLAASSKAKNQFLCRLVPKSRETLGDICMRCRKVYFPHRRNFPFPLDTEGMVSASATYWVLGGAAVSQMPLSSYSHEILLVWPPVLQTVQSTVWLLVTSLCTRGLQDLSLSWFRLSR